MKFQGVAGEVVELEPLSEYLVRKHGFDPQYLANDEGMLRLEVKDMSLVGQLKFAKERGRLPIPSLVHFTKKYRKANPTSVLITQLFAEIDYLAVVPAFCQLDDKSQLGKMDLTTRLFRLLGRTKTSELSKLTFPARESFEPFKVNLAYQLLTGLDSFFYIEEAAQYFAALGDNADLDIANYGYLISPSLFGFTSYVYVHEISKDTV